MQKLILCFSLLAVLVGCSSDPLDQKYNEIEGIEVLQNTTPPIDSMVIAWITIAKKTNDDIGVSNEGKTFRELKDQGLDIYSRRKAESIVDSIRQKHYAP